MKNVQQKRVISKATRDRQILAKARREGTEKPVSEGIRRAVKRAAIAPKSKHEDPITLRRVDVQMLLNLLEEAKHAAIAGAIPPRFAEAGPAHAVEAYRAIRFVQSGLRRALEGGAL